MGHEKELNRAQREGRRWARGAHGELTCIVYARVSSKDQEREGFSIPAQLELLRAYAGANGFTIAQEFIDVETAKAAGRTGFGADDRVPQEASVLPHHPGREDRPAVPEPQGLCHHRRTRHRNPLRQGERRPLQGLPLPREVHARDQGPDGQELHRQPLRGGPQGPAAEGARGHVAHRRPARLPERRRRRTARRPSCPTPHWRLPSAASSSGMPPASTR